MMRGKNCLLLACLPTCELAHYIYYAFSAGVSPPVSFLLVPFPRLAPPFRPALIVSSSRQTIREAWRFFSHPLVSFAEAHIPHATRRFTKLILSAVSSCRPVYRLAGRIAERHLIRRCFIHHGSGGNEIRKYGHGFLFNAIFSYLTFAMLKAKK